MSITPIHPKEQEIIETYVNNIEISLNDIQKMYNVGRRALNTILKRNGITKRKNQSEFCIKNQKCKLHEKFFLEETEKTAYFMGFNLADGSIFKAKKSKNFTWALEIHKKDKVLLDLFCDWLNIPKECILTHKNKIILRFTRNIFNNGFPQWGLVQNKTYKPTIPKIRKELIKSFLIGLIDGDGYIIFNKKGYKFNFVGNRILTSWFVSQIKELGYDRKITIYDEKPDKCWNRVSISKKEDVIELGKILDIQHAKYYLPRKWQNIIDVINHQ